MPPTDYPNSRNVYSAYAEEGHLGFAHPMHQRLRFAGLIRHVDVRGRSVLDFGCGHGELFTWLQDAGQAPASYHGVDLLSQNLEVAQRKIESHLPAEIARASVSIGGEPDGEYDVTCCLAVLSVDEGDATHGLWRETLRGLWGRTRHTLVFDLLRVEPGFPHPGHRRLEPAEIASWAHEISVNHVVDNTLADHLSLVVAHRAKTPTRAFWDLREGDPGA